MDKIALVTGGTRGIGHAVAAKLKSDGYTVIITGRGENADTGHIYMKCDISVSGDRVGLFRRIEAEYGKLDVLVNNAGIAPEQRLDVLETTEDSFSKVVDTNLKGTFFISQLAAKLMTGKIGGLYNPAIINISSISSYVSSISRGEYCISKAGIAMVTKLFADRLAEYGINVYEIRPGIIKTDMTAAVTEKYDKLIDGGLTPIKRWGFPEDVANAVSVLCGGGFRFSTGEVINVDGGYHLQRL